ncbi:MAG: outer membrane lipoprotein-sorting protein [Methanotrichaceae archaeon]|nr:outer membrane lipoprotein-sorting protein [Methanotrichaceae archaeon]
MRILLVILILAFIALSGCIEKGPSSEEIKRLTVKSGSNLNSYGFSVEQKQIETINNYDIQNGTYSANTTKRLAEMDIKGNLNISGKKAMANLSTITNVTGPGGISENRLSGGIQYNIGNSTYTKMDQDNWTQLKDPMPENEVWSSNRYNAIVSRVETINKSNLELLGEETINGYNTYKLRAAIDSEANYNTTYGMVSNAIFPFISKLNSSELEANSTVETTLWVDKSTYLPRQYENRVSVKVVPEIIGFFDPTRGQMALLNKSIMPAELSIESSTLEKYFDFNKTIDIAVPKEALATEPIVPMPLAVNPAET